jgi:hypothetical protein
MWGGDQQTFYKGFFSPKIIARPPQTCLSQHYDFYGHNMMIQPTVAFGSSPGNGK